MFEAKVRFLDSTQQKRNLTVVHEQSNIKVTSPDFTIQEKSDDQLKKEVWEVMKKAMEVWNIK
jgi:hypothetical protein